MNKAKLTPLGKLVALVLALTIGAVAGAAGASALRPHARAWRCVTVVPGDTLWSLASEEAEGDVRAGVHRIVEHNRLGPGPIHPGMGLWIPRPDDDAPIVREEAPASACPAVDG